MKWRHLALGLVAVLCSACAPQVMPCSSPPPKEMRKAVPFPETADFLPVAKPASVKPTPAISAISYPTIIIDPGHGGDDLGAQSHTKPNYCEKNFNLVTARHLQNFLEELGYRTVMTREKDVFVSLEDRAAFTAKKPPRLFVSVHYNSAPSPQAEGIEVYYYDDKEDRGRKQASKALAESVLKELVAMTKAKSRGTKVGNYHVIREASSPAILIEGGFITHPEELKRIKDPHYMKIMAWGAALGIDAYLKNK